MDVRKSFTCVFFCVFLWAGDAQESKPHSVLNCCEGDVLFLLDSSGSVASYEFSRMVEFLSDLLSPFSLGPDEVRVGLLQVGTEPHLEFGFDAYRSQAGLQAALKRTKQLKGDTNTVDALLMARDGVLKQGVPGGARPELPRVLVWLTDGVDPGEVQEPMARLKEEGVAVLVVSTGHGNYQVLRDVVSPQAEDHLFFVDIDDVNIITEDLRNSIIEIIRAKRLQVKSVTASSAVLEWRPVLAGISHYDIQFGPIRTGVPGGGGGSGTSPGTGLEPFKKITRPGDASSANLIGLRPDTTYTVTLTPKSNLEFLNSLSATFTTQPVNPPQPEVQTLSTVTVSDSTSNSVRLSWGPLLPNLIQGYQLEYSALPTGRLQVVTVSNRQNSTILTNLQPDTQYLVTVSARDFSGKERAMSVKVCTQEELPALSDLQLTTVGNESVQLRWRGSADGLRGYWVTWGQRGHTQRSTLYLPPNLLSTTLNHVPRSAQVCVSPVYRTARGEGICCTA